MPGDMWQKFAGLRTLYAYMFAHPGKKLLFMGCEIGQWDEWNCHTSVDWHLLQYDSHQKLQFFVSELNRLYKSNESLHQVEFSWDGFEWIDLHDSDNSTLSFLRKARDPRDTIICVFNLTPVPRYDYRLGVPYPGEYELILNSDADVFGGSNTHNLQYVSSQDIHWHGRNQSIPVSVPPLGALYYRLRK
jgi:1,4-alpha-glucan branching enzyme